MGIIVSASVALALVLGLILTVLARRQPVKQALPEGKTRSQCMREAKAHLQKAISEFEKRGDPDWVSRANLHLISALKLGANDGEAAERLAINLEKNRSPHHAMEVCRLILHDDYRMEKGSALGKKDFQNRLARYLEKYRGQAVGIPLFTPEEASAIIRSSKAA